MLYPLVFRPILKEHVWGGRRFEELYRKELPPGGLIGESWEITDRAEGVSVVANGPMAGKDLRWLMEHHAADLLGSARALNGRFPLLVKILDCRQAPSVQVHPPNEAAERLGGEPKTEIWYVTQAEPEARLIVGLRRGVKRGRFERKLGEGEVVDCLHTVPVRSGDVMFVPSGRVHAIGAGIVLYEVQQNSNTTYRIFDWNRVGPDGKPRELHIPQALAAMDFDDIEPDLVRSPFEGGDQAMTRRLADTPWFGVDEWRVQGAHRRSLGALDRPVVFGVVTGNVTVAAAGETVSLAPGQFCLVPASVQDAVFETGAGATCLVVAPGVQVEKEAAPLTLQSPAPTGIPPSRAHDSHSHGHETEVRRSPGEPTRRHSLLPSRRRLKHILSKRLTYSPFLKMLVLYFWFRIAVLALVVVGLITAVMLPRLWTTTPQGFVPVVKVSLLDKLQARMLRRGAEKAIARGDNHTAIEAWLNALANNMGNPDSARGLLRTALALDPIPAKNLGPAVQASDWLLRLTRTNRADLELVSAFLDKVQFYALAKAQLEPLAKEISGSLKMIYLKSVFFEGELDDYNRLWKGLTPSEQAQPDMALIRAGYLAGWGGVGTVAEARQVLDKAAGERGPLWSLANRLQMAVSEVRIDPERYVEALSRLQEVQQDSGVDNASYWELLATAGRKAEAVRLARNFASPPRDSYELVRTVEANLSLGLNDEALRMMRGFARYYPVSEDVWTTYARMLFDAKDWEGLRGAALQMRQFSMFRGRLDALSLFYEGRADLATARLDAAGRAFDAATNADFHTPSAAILTANSLLSLGYPTHARAILERAGGMLTNRVQYLDLMSRAAIQSKDEALMLSVCQAAYELQPSSIDSAHRYAAALLIRAERPEEAVRLTMDLNLRFPNSNALRINHALALLLNHRADDAEAVLHELAFSRLRPDEVNSYYQAMFELKVQKQDYTNAWQALDRIDWSLLFPSETNRLGKIRAALPPRPVSPPPSA